MSNGKKPWRKEEIDLYQDGEQYGVRTKRFEDTTTGYQGKKMSDAEWKALPKSERRRLNKAAGADTSGRIKTSKLVGFDDRIINPLKSGGPVESKIEINTPSNLDATSGIKNQLKKQTAEKTVDKVKGGFGEKLKEKMGGGGAGGFAQIAQGLAKTAGSLIGGGARRREQRAANKELKQRKQAYEDFEMKNVYEGTTNPYEDLKVNTQEAEFMAQQSQQGLANTLGSLSATAGGSGIAALAQTMAGQQAMNIQRAGASIGMQESRNEAMRAQGEERRQVRIAQGAADVQQFELGRTETLFDMAATRKKEADAARAKATQDLVGGIADVAVGGARVAMGGL